MKFKEGSRVEVLRRNEEPYGSWSPAKVLLVDGYAYTVRFEYLLTVEGEPAVGRVPAEDVRPCPPQADGEERWVPGDIAEVFDTHSWRVGKVVKALHKSYFVIKLFGSIQLKEFHISSLRVQQAWHSNKWIVIGKVGGKKERNNGLVHSKAKYAVNLDCRTHDVCQKCEQDSLGGLSLLKTVRKNLKFHFNTFPGDAVKRTGDRRITTPKLGGCHRITKSALPRKVDALSFSKYMVDDKCMHECIRGRMIKVRDMNVEKVDTNNCARRSFPVPLQATEDDNECSVASCSGNDFPEYTVQDSRKTSKEIVSSFLDDVASVCPPESSRKVPHVCKESFAADVHELELHAYQSTVQALYASGPLSWEQESLLTNLRLSLNISNEEHLLQLRHLLST